MAHLWHDIIIGPDSPNIVNAVIEVPKGCKNKYELDKPTGVIRVDRVINLMPYPENYGFIPQTYAMNGDPLDILVLSHSMVHPGCFLRAKPIGVVKMTDGGVRDDKIIAVAIDDPSVAKIEHVNNDKGESVKDYRVEQIERFLTDYKKYEKKKVEIGDFGTPTAAKKIITESFNEYNRRVQSGELVRP